MVWLYDGDMSSPTRGSSLGDERDSMTNDVITTGRRTRSKGCYSGARDPAGREDSIRGSYRILEW